MKIKFKVTELQTGKETTFLLGEKDCGGIIGNTTLQLEDLEIEFDESVPAETLVRQGDYQPMLRTEDWDNIELECRKAGLIIELKSYQDDVKLNNNAPFTEYVAMRGIIDLIKRKLSEQSA